MQNNTGMSFSDALLDKALSQRIDDDKSGNSSLLLIKHVLANMTNWKDKHYPSSLMNSFHDYIMAGRLPKFNNWQDRVNGLGITVHETWATHITLQSLEISENTFRAKLHYRIQDHFGLDDVDILSPFYKQFRIFRIWFLLQRWKNFGYKPFITEMNTTKIIEGKQSEAYVRIKI